MTFSMSTQTHSYSQNAVARVFSTTNLSGRLKREEERIAREMAEKEEEEARAVLEQAARSGKIKLPTADGKLDKEAILSQASSPRVPATKHPSLWLYAIYTKATSL